MIKITQLIVGLSIAWNLQGTQLSQCTASYNNLTCSALYSIKPTYQWNAIHLKKGSELDGINNIRNRTPTNRDLFIIKNTKNHTRSTKKEFLAQVTNKYKKRLHLSKKKYGSFNKNDFQTDKEYSSVLDLLQHGIDFKKRKKISLNDVENLTKLITNYALAQDGQNTNSIIGQWSKNKFSSKDVFDILKKALEKNPTLIPQKRGLIVSLVLTPAFSCIEHTISEKKNNKITKLILPIITMHTTKKDYDLPTLKGIECYVPIKKPEKSWFVRLYEYLFNDPRA